MQGVIGTGAVAKTVVAAVLLTAVTTAPPVVAGSSSATGPQARTTLLAPRAPASVPPGCVGGSLPGTSAPLPLSLACPGGSLFRSPAPCPARATPIACDLPSTVPSPSPAAATTRRASAGHQAAAAGAPAGRWRLVSAPRPVRPLQTVMYGAACPAPRDCWAVGVTSAGISVHPTAEHWDGRRWRVVPTPAPLVRADLVIAALDSVTCTSPRNCWAVGMAYTGMTDRPLVEHWNGSRWAMVDAPNSGEFDILLGVSCSAAADCWAVGQTFRMYACPHSQCGYYTLAEHWDGQRWRVVSTPNPFTGTATAEAFSVLSSVDCSSRRQCWSVGYIHDGTQYHSITARWDGHHWTSGPPSADSIGSGSALLGVSCADHGSCWAVGMKFAAPGAGPEALMSRWTGRQWSLVAPPTTELPTSTGALFAVSCPARISCTAVGYTTSADGTTTPRVDRWDGNAWKTQSPQTQSGRFGPGTLRAVSCPTSEVCAATGDHARDVAAPQPLAVDITHAGWRPTLEHRTGVAGAALFDITCTTAADCWAVGEDSASDLPLALHLYDGRWHVVRVPLDHAASVGVLQSISCSSRASCWGVGWAFRDGSMQPLAEHWDGHRWRLTTAAKLPAPKQPDAASITEAVELDTNSAQWLAGVDCASPTNCWAVGGVMLPSGATQPLIERWDGHSWALAASPPDGVLTAVACPGKTSCWAVGSGATATVEHWDGAAWVLDSSAATGTTSGGFSSVECTSATACWAAGSSLNTNGNFYPLVSRWNGATWNTVPTDAGGQLSAIACSRNVRCWTVGGSAEAAGEVPLAEWWTGTGWSDQQTAPLPPPVTTRADALLLGAACTRGACWAVGYRSDGENLYPLIEHISTR